MLSISSGMSLLKVLRTQIQMVQDRGYNLDPNDETILLFDPSNEIHVTTFLNVYREAVLQAKVPFRQILKKVYVKGEKGPPYPLPGSTLLVYYASPEAGHQTIGIGPVKTIIGEALKITSLGWLIIISETEFTSEAVKELAKIKTYPIQHFLDISLMYNPVRHELVPKHIPLSEEEALALERNNKIKRRQLPLLRYGDLQSRAIEKKKRVVDPIVSYYGFRPGQIVRIVRNNFIVDTLVDRYIAYRFVWY